MDKSKFIEKNSIVELKGALEGIKKENDLIHLNMNFPRKHLKNVPSKITGVYNNFFCVECDVKSYRESFTIEFVDILTKKIEIVEFKSL